MKNYLKYFAVLCFLAVSCKSQKETVVEEKKEQQVENNQKTTFNLEEIKGDYRVYFMNGMGENFSSVPTISIDTSGIISGSTGCNTFSGKLSSKKSGNLIDKIATTRMACQDEAMEMEFMMLQSLKKATEIRPEGENDLFFIAENNVMIKAKKIVLENNFRITKFNNKDVSDVAMGFDVNSQEFILNGSTGCNSFSAQFVQDGFNIGFSEISATEMACEGFDSALESEFLSILQVINRYSVTNDNMYLFFTGDKEVFRAVNE